jgi:hypothetical protein
MISEHIRAVKVPEGGYTLTRWEKFQQWIFDLWDKADAPLYRHSTALTLEEYRKLPKRFWYLLPKFSMGRGSDQERKNIETYIQQTWPIEHFIREKILMHLTKFRVTMWWNDQIDTRVSPRQEWLTTLIPRTWADKTWLVPELNFALIIHFVEVEKCFEHTDYDTDRASKKFAKELRTCYDYIKTGRPALQAAYDKALDEAGNTGDYFTDYAKSDALEKQLKKSDDKWLTWIVIHRDLLWT